MRKALIAVGVIVVVGAFLAGFWLQWSQKRVVERELAAARLALEENQRHLRVCGLENRLLAIVMAAQAHNFGIAAEQAQRLTTDLDTLATTEIGRAHV
jgi:type II secretory pathway pseudopilin PulG